MSEKITWGVLSTAKIGLNKVIPAMQKGKYSTINAIASRNLETAQHCAKESGIPKAFGSYNDLLADPEIQAVYIPLPNHLHVEWTEKALEAGKHVLCEKPIAMNHPEAVSLQKFAARFPHLKVMEAFMYRHHPQWLKAKQLVDEKAIGKLRTIQAFFSYHNVNPNDIRNQADIGGGGLLDIGCYCISLSRFLFDREPERVSGSIQCDPKMNIDRLVSGILDFGKGTATFTCSTQLSHYQRVNIFGSRGRIEIEIPFNAPCDKSCRLWLQTGSEIEEITLEVCDQYTIQGDLFSQAILNDSPVPTPLQDAVNNMNIIDAIKESDELASWIVL